MVQLLSHMREKWGGDVRSEVMSLFENDTFVEIERSLSADEIIPIKLTLKTKLSSNWNYDMSCGGGGEGM